MVYGLQKPKTLPVQALAYKSTIMTCLLIKTTVNKLSLAIYRPVAPCSVPQNWLPSYPQGVRWICLIIFNLEPYSIHIIMVGYSITLDNIIIT